MSIRCDATNERGARCLWPDNSHRAHFFADDPGRDSFDLGKLQQAVRSFLAGQTDLGFLGEKLAETEAER